MKTTEHLMAAVAASADHQERLKAAGSEEQAVAALLEIARIEGLALERAELERAIAEARGGHTEELTDADLSSISAGISGDIWRVNPIDAGRIGRELRDLLSLFNGPPEWEW